MRLRMSLIGLALVTACWHGMACGDANAGAEVVARVGQENITRQDVVTRRRLNEAQPGMSTGPEAALFQLVRAACLRDIARGAGFPLIDDDLAQEVARIDSHTRMPDQLNALKALCADTAEYARVFVLPDFSERWLHARYGWAPRLHAASGRKAEAVLAEVLGGEKDWKALAQRKGLECRMLRISRENGIQPVAEEQAAPAPLTNDNFIDASNGQPPANVAATAKAQLDASEQEIVNQLIEKVLTPMQPGGIHGRVIQMETDFLVLRLTAISGHTYAVETISMPKTSYDAWVAEQLATTPIEIGDQTLWKAMTTKLPEAPSIFASARALAEISTAHHANHNALP